MGEIGFQRHEFLFSLVWWEIKSIIRGYNARYHHSWEQARLVAYHAKYCLGVPKDTTVPSVSEWIVFPWEKSFDKDDELPDNQEVERLRQMMREENARNEAKTKEQ